MFQLNGTQLMIHEDAKSKPVSYLWTSAADFFPICLKIANFEKEVLLTYVKQFPLFATHFNE